MELKNTKSNREKTSITLECDFKKQLQIFCLEKGVTLSGLLEQLAINFLKNDKSNEIVNVRKDVPLPVGMESPRQVKDLKNAYMREYRAKNQEQQRAYMKKYREDHKEERKGYNNRYWENRFKKELIKEL